MSCVLVPAAFALGVVLVIAHVPGRFGGLAVATVIAIPVVSLLILLRIPVVRRLHALRDDMPDAIIELGERGVALSKDLAKISAADGAARDTRFRTVCLVFDNTGVSGWRSSDVATPEWLFPWDRLSAPVVGVVDDSFLGFGGSFRGLEFRVSVEGNLYRLRLVILGAGFLGAFALSRRELEAIAARCTELRETALSSS